MRQVLIYPGEDGYWVVECPSLPGSISQGRTKQEAISNIRDAISEYISSLEEDGVPIPENRLEATVPVVCRLPRISGPDCVRALGKANFAIILRPSSHIILRRDNPYTRAWYPIIENWIAEL